MPMKNYCLPNRFFDTLLFLALFFPIVRPAHAVRSFSPQKSDPLTEPYRWQQFHELDGKGVLCLSEGPGGVWFGTASGGVMRHDGMHCDSMGLPGNPVRQLIMMKSEALLAATDRGIFRFENGGWIRVFPAREGRCWIVRSLLETSDGSLWAGTAWGAVRIKDNRTTLYTSADMAALFKETQEVDECVAVPGPCTIKKQWTDGLGLDIVADAVSPKSVLVRLVKEKSPAQAMGILPGDCYAVKHRNWFFEADGSVIPLLAGDTLLVTRPGGSKNREIAVAVSNADVNGTYSLFPVTQLFSDRTGALWLGVGEDNEGLVVRAAPSAAAWRPYSKGQCPAIGGGKSGTRMVQDKTRKLWLISDSGISRFNGQSWEPVRPDGPARGYSVAQTKDGSVWIGGISELHRFDSGSWTTYRPPAVPLPDGPLFLLETADGALWMAGVGGGVARLDYETTRWTTYEGLNFQCETRDHAQWFLSKEGRVVRYDGGRWYEFGTEDGLMKTTHQLLATRSGDCWAVGTNGVTASLSMFNGNRFLKAGDAGLKGDPSALVLYEDRDGSLWVGASWRSGSGRPAAAWGAARFFPAPGSRQLGRWTVFTDRNRPASVAAIGQAKDGTLWFGDERLIQYDGGNWRVVEEPAAVAAGILDMVTSRDGILFLGTRSNGLAAYNGTAWTLYSTRDGLADDKITGLLETRNGTLWASTEKGVSHFDGTTWNEFGSPQSFCLFRRGAGSRESLKESHDGALWINRESRTVRFMPSGVAPETVLLSDFKNIPRPGNAFIQWTGIDRWHATPDEAMRFSTRLDGGPWSPFSSERRREFPWLKSGMHSLDVRARNMDLQVDPTHASLRFAVEPPVTRKWWFMPVLCALAGFILFGTAAILLWNRSLRRTNRDLGDQVRQFQQARDGIDLKAEMSEKHSHDLQDFAYAASRDLQEPLKLIYNNVSLLSMRYRNKLGSDADEFIGMAVDGARRAQQIINDLVLYFKINVHEKTMQGVSAGAILKRVLRNLKQILDDSEAAVTADALPDVTGDEKQIEALMQNLLVNAVEYRRKGEAPRIHVSARDEETLWHFTVQDNGIGIAKEHHEKIFIPFQRLQGREGHSGTGIGLAVCRKIAERHGGKCWVESEPNRGSVFHFTLSKSNRISA